MKVWASAAGHCVSRNNCFADNILYTVDLGYALYSFTLYFTTSGMRRVEITKDAVTVGWPDFGSEADERVMIESVVHMITGHYLAFKELTCRT